MSARQTFRRGILLAVVLAALELLLRAILAFPPLARHLATNDDLSYRRLWVNKHRTGSAALGRIDRFDPLLGWRPRPNLSISPIWDGKRLTTNDQGFRSTGPFSIANPPSTTRIVALGDSFTFGEEVGDDETWAQRLEELCPALEVLNLGVHGYGHDQVLLLLREVGIAFRPDIVLLGYLKTDMYRNLLTFRDYAKPRFALRGGELRLLGVPVPEPASVLRRDPFRPRFLDLGAIASTRFQNLTGIRTLRKNRITAALLAEIASVARDAGAQPAFAYFPAEPDFESAADNRERESFFWRTCQEIEGIVCVSVSEAMLRAAAAPGSCCQVPSGHHWNAEGHHVAAVSLLGSLREAGLVSDCRPAQPALTREGP